MPGPGSKFIARWPEDESLNDKAMTTLAGIWNGLIPIPRPTRTFWNTNLLDDHLNARFYLSWALLLVVAAALARRRTALVLLGCGFSGLMAFTFFQFVGATRHQGLLFVVLMAACWIAKSSPERPAPRGLRRLNAWLEPRLDRLLVGLLAVHAVSGVAANVADHRLPFSASRQIAEYVRREFPADTLLVGYDDYGLAPVGALLDRRIYSPEQGTLPPFFSQDDRARREVTIDELIEQVERLRGAASRPVLVALTPRRRTDLDDWRHEHPDGPPWELLARFDDSTVTDEGVDLYLAHPLPQPPPVALNFSGGLVAPALDLAPRAATPATDEPKPK